MRTALAVGFGWPRRLESGVAGLDLLAHGRLDFEAPDTDAFPCLRLAYAALEAGGTAPATLNAANEVAVSSFLQGRIGFLSVPALVEETLAALPAARSEEHTSELQSLMRISYAVFCLKNKTYNHKTETRMALTTKKKND